ncbi:AtpZ/AtpI family protein [Candidatus Gottesmanbacteria bacterium]|nr:AtpZ/AtpI family protein [Candidatus Gottesmanbacteria bacterium]
MQAKERYDLILNGSGLHKTKKEDSAKTGSIGPDWYYYLGFVGHIGFTIAVPIAGGALLGGYVDRVWSIYPKGTLSFLLLGIVISGLSFYKIVRDIITKK